VVSRFLPSSSSGKYSGAGRFAAGPLIVVTVGASSVPTLRSRRSTLPSRSISISHESPAGLAGLTPGALPTNLDFDHLIRRSAGAGESRSVVPQQRCRHLARFSSG
jgi:hypothetical protein